MDIKIEPVDNGFEETQQQKEVWIDAPIERGDDHLYSESVTRRLNNIKSENDDQLSNIKSEDMTEDIDIGYYNNSQGLSVNVPNIKSEVDLEFTNMTERLDQEIYPVKNENHNNAAECSYSSSAQGNLVINGNSPALKMTSRARRLADTPLNDHRRDVVEDNQASSIVKTETRQRITDMDFVNDKPTPVGVYSSGFTDFHSVDNVDNESLFEKDVESLSPNVFSSVNNDIDDSKLIFKPKIGLLQHISALNSDEKNNQDELGLNNHECVDSDDDLFIKDKRKLNKKLRVLGKKYSGIRTVDGHTINIERAERKIRNLSCGHRGLNSTDRSFLCGLVDEQARLDVFHHFWSLPTWEAKKRYIFGLVNTRKVIKRRQLAGSCSVSKRNNGFDCFLPVRDGENVRVCRKIFNATLDITKDSFSQWISLKQIDDENRMDRKRKRLVAKPLKSDSVQQWFDILPKVSSRYCRESCTRTHVGDAFKSKSEMHSVYKLWCGEKGVASVQRKKFCEILELNKISIFKPDNDQCEACVSYEEGNLV